MDRLHARRSFLSQVGKGMLIATVGPSLAADLGLAHAAEGAPETRLTFGKLEELVSLLQETPGNKINAALVARIKAGTSLRTLTAAAALANARSFGGEDYVGFHTLMALGPAYRMSQQMPEKLAALPVMKVLYRNTNRIQEHGGVKDEVLHPVEGNISPADGNSLRDAVHAKDTAKAERILASIASHSPDEAFNALLMTVQDNTEVHRVVLPYRAWDMLDLVGMDQATTMLRQSVRYCVQAERWQRPAAYDRPRQLLPELLTRFKLMDRPLGTKPADDAFVEKLAETIFTSTPDVAAEAAASALAEGFAPDIIGEAMSLAANQLILRDHGRTPREESPGKPLGSTHGDSIGVHACDSANAWRNMARAANPRNTYACLILGCYQVAYDRINRGGDFISWQPLPLKQHLDGIKSEDSAALLREAEEAIRGNLQARAAAIAGRMGQLKQDPKPLFDLMLKYATTEDGSLHAEKFYNTASQEFKTTRPAFQWRQLVALSRVTASEYGRPAPGLAEARDAGGVSCFGNFANTPEAAVAQWGQIRWSPAGLAVGPGNRNPLVMPQ